MTIALQPIMNSHSVLIPMILPINLRPKSFSADQPPTEDSTSADQPSSDTLPPFLNDSNVHPLSHGSLNSSFMEAEDAIKLLTPFTYEQSHSSIPEGIKNDVFFLVRNDNNINIRGKGKCPCFFDDCGL